MPQGAAHSGDKRAGGNPNGGTGGSNNNGGSKGGASGGMGSFGNRGTGYGGVGYAGPGAGAGFHPGDQSIPGSRNTLHNVPTRPASWGNLAEAARLGLGMISGPVGAMGMLGGAMMGNDPYSGPTGTGHMIEHDSPGGTQMGSGPGQYSGLAGVNSIFNHGPIQAPSPATLPPMAQAPGQPIIPRPSPIFSPYAIPGGQPYGVNIFGPMR